MSFTTTLYFAFLLVGAIIYYLMPKKYRWTILLIMSYMYYMTFHIKGMVFMLFTTITVYILGRVLENMQLKADAYLKENKETLARDEKKKFKNSVKKKKRWVLVLALLLNFGMLAVLKYSGFTLDRKSVV